MTESLPSVTLPNGEAVPAFGQGTWHMGEDRRRAADEEAALKLGIELGINLIDTAEMYGNGGAEEVVAEVAQGQRNKLFIVSKVYPQNASRSGVPQACAPSLKRLRPDPIHLSMLHCTNVSPTGQLCEPIGELVGTFSQFAHTPVGPPCRTTSGARL